MGLKPVDPETWFNRADQFELSARWLMTDKARHGVAAFPHIVMRAFAAEAYFKCLISLGGGSPPPIHNLLALFKKLDEKAKKEIRKGWNDNYKPKMLALRRQPDKPKIKVPISLEGILQQSGDAFLLFRYLPKGGEAAFTIMNLPLIVREIILARKPGWRPVPVDPLAFDTKSDSFPGESLER